jgi:hypothetical protein
MSQAKAAAGGSQCAAANRPARVHASDSPVAQLRQERHFPSQGGSSPPSGSGARPQPVSGGLPVSRLWPAHPNRALQPKPPRRRPPIAPTLHRSLPRASPETRRSTSDRESEVLRRVSGESPARLRRDAREGTPFHSFRRTQRTTDAGRGTDCVCRACEDTLLEHLRCVRLGAPVRPQRKSGAVPASSRGGSRNSLSAWHLWSKSGILCLSVCIRSRLTLRGL